MMKPTLQNVIMMVGIAAGLVSTQTIAQNVLVIKENQQLTFHVSNSVAEFTEKMIHGL